MMKELMKIEIDWGGGNVTVTEKRPPRNLNVLSVQQMILSDKLQYWGLKKKSMKMPKRNLVNWAQ